MRTPKVHAPLSTTLLQNLETALNVRPLPQGLADDLAIALRDNRGNSKKHDRNLDRQQREAVTRIAKTCTRLQRDITRASAAFDLAPATKSVTAPSRRKRFIWESWQALGPPAEDARNKLDRWLASKRDQRRPGDPGDRLQLRRAVFRALDDAGFRITNTARSRVGRAFALILEEADRREGTVPRKRENIDTKKWKRWVHDFILLTSTIAACDLIREDPTVDTATLVAAIQRSCARLHFTADEKQVAILLDAARQLDAAMHPWRSRKGP